MKFVKNALKKEKRRYLEYLESKKFLENKLEEQKIWKKETKNILKIAHKKNSIDM